MAGCREKGASTFFANKYDVNVAECTSMSTLKGAVIIFSNKLLI